nr:DUF6624 domain-containing protein [Flavihumibacter solisilvae]
MNMLLSMIRRKDSVNQLKVGSILDKYGWLGPAEIGAQGNQTLFLVIQHAERPVQEKYFDLMKKAVESGKLKASSFALLEDRLALKQGKYQIYGSQIRWDMSSNSYQVMPIRDPEHVDIRRANVGLPPISVYLLELGIEWDIVKYKMYVSKLALELGLKNE